MQLKQIYAISRGEYSEYSVVAIFGDQATAEAWAHAMRQDPGTWSQDYRVETFHYIEAGTKPQKIHTVDLSQDLWDDGTEGHQTISESHEYPIMMFFGLPPARPRVRFIRAPVHKNLGGRLEIRGRSKSAVMKVYGDQIRMWRANPVAFRRDEKP